MKNTILIRTNVSRLLVLASAFVFTFCSKDDEVSKPQFVFSIDGTAQKVQITSGMLLSEIQYGHEGRALYITAVGENNKTLSIGVSNWDFQNPPANGILTGEYDATFDFEDTQEENPFGDCLAVEGATLCDGGLVTLMLENNSYFSAFDGATDATITITKCDAGKRLVSGTFSAKVGSFDGVQQYTVAGSFDNLTYLVQ